MFGRQRSVCHRIKGQFSLYLDDRLNPIERDTVRYHTEVCDDCRRDLESLESTVRLLHRMPVAFSPRYFTLVEAPRRQARIPFDIPRLRMATATAVIVLAVMLAGDLTGFLHTEAGSATGIANNGELAIAAPPETGVITPAITPTDTTTVEGILIEAPKADGPSSAIPESTGIASLQTPDGAGNEGASATDRNEAPQSMFAQPVQELTHEKAYPWLRPIEITFAALVFILGGLNLLVRRRKWHPLS